MTAQEFKIKHLQEELHKEQLKTLKLRMRMAVLIQFPCSSAAEKISKASLVDFSDSIIHFN